MSRDAMVLAAQQIWEDNASYVDDEIESEVEELAYERDGNHAVALIAAQAVIMALILLGNATVIYLTVSTRKLRTPTNLYITSLCVADISVAVLPVPLHVITTLSNWEVNSSLCKSLEYFNFFATMSNSYCVVVIAMDRHRSVVNPFHRKMTSAGCFRRIAAVWVVGALYAIRAPTTYDVAIIRHLEHGQLRNYHVCVTLTDQNTRRSLIILDSVAICLLPFSMIVGMYIHILFTLFIKQRKVAMALGINIHTQLMRRNRHILKMVVAITSLSMFCEVPVYIWEMYVFFGGGSFPGSLLMYDILKLLSYSNSWLNVLVYVGFNQSLRKALRDRKCCIRRVNPVRYPLEPIQEETRVLPDPVVEPVGQTHSVANTHNDVRVFSIG